MVRAVAVSLALGGIIGLERQSHREPESPLGSVGVRTFALSSLLGTVSVIAQEILPALPYVVGLGYFALLVAFFWHERRATEHEVGITTQISAMVVFVLGVLVPSMPMVAASIAVIVAIVLSLKRHTTTFVHLLTPAEIVSTMKFLLVTVVLLPLLPEEPVDPWGIYNLREIWLLVVLISGISFLGYFAIRFLGTSRGLVLTGVLGGMASSTAVALAMSRQVHLNPQSRTVLLSAAFAIMLANAFMFARVTVAVAVVNLELVKTLWLPFALMAIPGSLVAGLLWVALVSHVRDRPDGRDEPPGLDEGTALEIRNPFELVPALKFALVLVVIIGVAQGLGQMYGSQAIYLTAIFGGLAETNAISLAVARMAGGGELTASLATRAIVIAILTNSLVKAGLSAIVGSRRLGAYVAMGIAPIMAVGLLSAFLLL